MYTKCQSPFSGKDKENVAILSSAESAQRAVKVKYINIYIFSTLDKICHVRVC